MEFFLFLLVKAYLSSIFTNCGILVFALAIPLIYLSNNFVIKNSNGYRRVLLVRLTVASPKS